MRSRVRHLLLTGLPGCGKTTLVRRIIDQLRELRLAGFYTQELRGHDGRRVGFEAIGLCGRSTTLASVRSKSKMRVGRYGVELSGFEKLIQGELQRTEDVDLFVVDEVGKMECFSNVFVEAMRTILDGDVPLLGTIAMKGGGFIREVKEFPGIELVTVTQANRDSLPTELAARFSAS